MTDDLTKAIAELLRVTPPNSPWEAGDIGVGSSPVDYHIATILNAVISGDLIPTGYDDWVLYGIARGFERETP